MADWRFGSLGHDYHIEDRQELLKFSQVNAKTEQLAFYHGNKNQPVLGVVSAHKPNSFEVKFAWFQIVTH